MIWKLRKALAEWLWPVEPKVVRMTQYIPVDHMYAFNEYETMARTELQAMGGDTTTMKKPLVERERRYASNFTVYWECQHMSERWRVNPYLPKEYLAALEAQA